MNKTMGYPLLHEGVLALQQVEQNGMYIDVEYCERKKQHLTKQIERLNIQFKESSFAKHWKHYFKSKTNYNSNWQLSHMLYKVKKINPPKVTNTEQGSVDDKALTTLNLPELAPLIEIRKLQKIRDTYLDAFLREQTNGILHPFYNLHTVSTYRSSSQSPNFQNIPRRDEKAMNICRRAILPHPGQQLLEIDYQGIEVRISACYHKDPTMLRYIKNPDSDLHLDMAKEIFCLQFMDKKTPEHKILRDAAKNGFVFPQFYGDYYLNCAENIACNWGQLPKGRWKEGQGINMPAGKLSDHLISCSIKSFNAFVEHIKSIEANFWEDRFPIYKRWKERAWQKYQMKGHIDTLTGFRCQGVMRKNEVLNAPIQGSAFHCLLWSLIQIEKTIRNWKSRSIGQIHDALIFSVESSELNQLCKLVRQIMCHDIRDTWDWIIVPLEIEADICEVGEAWNKKKSFKI